MNDLSERMSEITDKNAGRVAAHPVLRLEALAKPTIFRWPYAKETEMSPTLPVRKWAYKPAAYVILPDF
jgi:hypothetical protein